MLLVAVTTASPVVTEAPIRAQVSNLNFWYGKFQALHDVTMPIRDNKVTAIIGPSGCGKSTLLRCFNRIHDLYPGSRYEGQINLAPENINLVAKGIDPILVRLLVGMVFQKPNPFPKSIFENVAAGLYVRGGEETAAWQRWADRIEGIAPYIRTSTLGANPATNLTWALMAHRDPVIHRDRIEFLRDTARLLDFAGHHLPEILEMDMAGHELGERIHDSDDGLSEIGILYTGCAP